MTGALVKPADERAQTVRTLSRTRRVTSVEMPKRLLEEAFSPADQPSKFSKGCILLSNSPVKLPELVAHLSSNLEELIRCGEHSKILILDGTHGNKVGTDGMKEKTFYQVSFLEETCQILGTRHHLNRKRSLLPNYEKIK